MSKRKDGFRTTAWVYQFENIYKNKPCQEWY
jgi:hypothetical protein